MEIEPSAYPASIEIDAGQIHLWCLEYGSPPADALIARYRTMLNSDERHQAERFYFARDRLRYLQTRVLVRTVLSRYTGIEPASLSFKTNDFGKPRLADSLPRILPVEFNVSHTHSLIVLAVIRGEAIGVDTENVLRDAPLNIAGHFFSAPEAAELQDLAVDRQAARFFEYWTLKEAYIKARGMGLSIPLDRFSFKITGARIALHVDPSLNDDASLWQFWQFRLREHYLISLCAKRMATGTPAVIVRECVPLVSDTLAAYQLIRGSV